MGATNVDVLTKLDGKMMRLVERTRGVLTGSNNKSWLDNPLSGGERGRWPASDGCAGCVGR